MIRQRETENFHAGSPALIDEGLRDHMSAVYGMMSVAIAITGIVSWLFGTVPDLTAMIVTPEGGMTVLGWVALFSPLAVVIAMGVIGHKASLGTLRAMLLGMAGMFGLSLSTIFMTYTGTSIASTFLVTASAFAGLSIYGYVTKRDLSAIGAFLIMGLIGLIVASLVNLFLRSETMGFALNVIGVLIFAGLTAFDTQKVKGMYFEFQGENRRKAQVFGALTLYLDFINLFLHLLKLMGQKR